MQFNPYTTSFAKKRKKKSNCILSFLSSIGTNCWFADIEKSLSSSIHFFSRTSGELKVIHFVLPKEFKIIYLAMDFNFLKIWPYAISISFLFLYLLCKKKNREKLNKCNNNKEGKAISTIIHLQKECQSRASIFNNMLFNLFFFSLSFLFYYSLSSNTLNSNQNKNNNNWKCLKWFVHTTNYYVSPLQNYTKRNEKLENIRLKRE